MKNKKSKKKKMLHKKLEYIKLDVACQKICTNVRILCSINVVVSYCCCFLILNCRKYEKYQILYKINLGIHIKHL